MAIIRINKPVGNNMDNLESDVRSIRGALETLGFVQPDDAERDPQGRPLGMISQRLDNSIKTFQAQKKLKIDGIIRPDGETLPKLNENLVLSQNERPPSKIPVPVPKPRILVGQDNMDVINIISDEEKNYPYLYKDSRGHVTVGIGVMIPSRDAMMTIDMYKKDGDQVVDASDDDKRAAYDKVKNDPSANYTADYYNPEDNKNMDDLWITKEKGKGYAYVHLLDDAAALRKNIKDFDKLPVDAQVALLDMRYNLGPKFNKSNWKKLFSAVEKGDWDTAAKESKRIGVHTDRNTKTYERFKNLSTKDEAKN